MKTAKTLTSALLIILVYNYQQMAQGTLENQKLFRQSYQFDSTRSNEQQFFISETEVKTYNADGTLATKDFYRLYLKYVPGDLTEDGVASYTCSKFEIITNDSVSRTVPALKNWSYTPFLDSTGMDEKNQVFGIAHTKFENLVDDNNSPFPKDKSYFIYNTFIDFHAFCNVFAEKTIDGSGIQNLHKIGDEIIHSASNSKPPVNLGSNVKEGSYFKNGEITLAFKGLSLTNDKITAIIHYDSGESSFKMIMEPMKDLRVNTSGRSHYFGDIFIDPDTKWVQKVVVDELVVAKTTLPFPPNEINSVTERHSQILNVSGSEYENQL